MTSGGWLLHGWGVRYFTRELYFFLSWDLHQLTRTDPDPPRLVNAWEAEHAIRMIAGTPECRGERIIEKLYRAVTRCFGLPSLSPRDLQEHMLSKVLDAVKWGQLVAVEVEWSAPPQYSAAPEPPEEQPAEERPPATFDLQVVLDVDGSPVGQLSLGVKEPTSDEFRSLRTDGDGHIHIAHTVRGTGDVRGDVKGARLDQSAVAVAGERPESRTMARRPRTQHPPVRYVVKLEEYRVRDGDSVGSVSARAGMNWKELAYFNWGTRDGEEINRHLASAVGCSKKAPDGSYVFSGDDWPGIIRIPRPFSKDGLPTDEMNILRVEPAQARVASWVKLSAYYEDAWHTPWPLHELQLDIAGATIDDALTIDHKQQAGAD